MVRSSQHARRRQIRQAGTTTSKANTRVRRQNTQQTRVQRSQTQQTSITAREINAQRMPRRGYVQLQLEDIRLQRALDNDVLCRLSSPPTITDQRVFQLKQNEPEELPNIAMTIHNIEIAWIFFDTCAYFFKDNVHEAKDFILSVLTVDIMNQLWGNIGYEESYDVYIVGCFFSRVLSEFRAFILPHIIQTLEDIGYLGLGGRVYVEGNNLVYKKTRCYLNGKD
ncbi:hypothetical protein RhiirA5_365572 [Rhizophagus irregularis]|uniref:Uncharacterized protein n=3 Tax=Rhizophagus irregularis TaxID=588596 RepID=U9UJW0_RHIID|nr:hypothetical protein GLOIN_2v1611549 [Rhizophagus irregularis DAOM 181602=DAOM 197198]EXX51633.1 hypothetical protein RirG_260090 [Rhizophagus irregularis DAOM 197198w]PKC00632.1 hypothetical protein RhiirA5_365572 [Rhizophagus irregularis]PKC73900.1 hypothetical protein RhiirA1_409968 [Rhizophagus irregularis]PKY30413.1 hypothetical protein RhiirB3_418718 [Rhizophagus irregularis]POG71062.1 hypothetical protein GLOIN_2v1611549 [Rhizophagus irregularis DAOM 181602=DAOM 197198]|eukprot:XP_025177928.1 hypothetical protein GLOIN_2v1611549 [Rhizophagus irregularis DAOM 181602=DAOM 197198]